MAKKKLTIHPEPVGGRFRWVARDAKGVEVDKSPPRFMDPREAIAAAVEKHPSAKEG